MVLCLSMELMGLERVPSIGEDCFAQSPVQEGLMQDHENIDLILMEEPSAREEETAMIILHQDEQEISDQGEAYLALYVDLPEVIGLLCLKALYGF